MDLPTGPSAHHEVDPMAATDTHRLSDTVPWSPLSAPASIFPMLLAPAQDDVGTTFLADLGGPLPFGFDPVAPNAEERE